MRRNGNLPNFVTKYCVPRYGTSFEAEHRHEKADEAGNANGQVFNMSAGARSTSGRWTIKDGFHWYIFSNLGFVGSPWNNICYEEDYAFPASDRGELSLLFGGYINIGQGIRYAGNFSTAYIATGKELESVVGWSGVQFGPNHILYGNYYWADERKNYPDTPGGSTSVTRPEYLIDHSAFCRTPRRLQSAGGWIRSYLAGIPMDNPTKGAWSSAFGLDRVWPGNLAYDSFAGEFSAGIASNNWTHVISKNEVVVDEEGTQLKHNENSAEIVIFGYNGNGHYAFAQELGRMLDFGIFLYPQSAEFRHLLLGTGINGSTQFSLAYVSPELDGYEIVELPEQDRIYSLVGVSTNFCILKKDNLYDLYYRLTPIVTDSEAMPNIMAFGSWYLDMVSRVATDAETSEAVDFSAVLPPNDGEAYGYSSGAYGTMALYVPDRYADDGVAYIVSKYAVFRIPCYGSFSDENKLMAYPALKHVREFVLIRDQVLYKIRETEFTAYDMQTFLRLDNLPGFQSAVEKARRCGKESNSEGADNQPFFKAYSTTRALFFLA